MQKHCLGYLILVLLSTLASTSHKELCSFTEKTNFKMSVVSIFCPSFVRLHDLRLLHLNL